MSAIGIQREPAIVHGAIPILGHALKFGKDPLGFLDTLRDQGELVRLKLGPRPVYVVCSPKLLGELLGASPEVFIVDGPMWESIRKLFGNGLPVSNGATHRRQRRMIQPAFRREQIAIYAQTMQKEASAMASSWRPGEQIDINRAMFDLSAHVVTRSLLKTDVVDSQSFSVGVALRTLFVGMVREMVLSALPLPQVFTRGSRTFREALATLHRIVDEIIAQRRRTGSHHDDLIATMLAACDEKTGEPLSDAEIHDQVISFLVAGADTVAASMTWLLHHLSQYPEVAEKLCQELSIAAARGELDFSRLRELSYLRNVISESMRLQPAVWIFTRRAAVATELGGYTIPAGADVSYSPYAMQRDPRSFDNPLRFDPDRWMPERAACIPRLAMEPFGAGDRRCPGDHFAVTEMAMMAIAVISRWRLLPQPETDPRIRVGITLRPRRLLMQVEPRDIRGRVKAETSSLSVEG
jgi:epi-isozizaene 5-monooxygenase